MLPLNNTGVTTSTSTEVNRNNTTGNFLGGRGSRSRGANRGNFRGRGGRGRGGPRDTMSPPFQGMLISNLAIVWYVLHKM